MRRRPRPTPRPVEGDFFRLSTSARETKASHRSHIDAKSKTVGPGVGQWREVRDRVFGLSIRPLPCFLICATAKVDLGIPRSVSLWDCGIGLLIFFARMDVTTVLGFFSFFFFPLASEFYGSEIHPISQLNCIV